MPKKYEVICNPKKGSKYMISIWDHIEDYEDYEKLFEKMARIGKDDEVKLYVSTPGGRCDIGFVILNRIRELPCQVDVVVPYPTYSMGAILALSGHSLKIQPGAFLMFHDYSTGTKGKGNEIFKQTEAYKETFEYLFTHVCQPFLTQKECEDILNGQDFYVKWNDKNLKQRLKRHFGG